VILDALLELEDVERVERIETAWSNLLQTEDGQIVVATLLDELGLFNPIGNQDQQTRHNVAVMILSRIHRNSTRRVLAALVKEKG